MKGDMTTKFAQTFGIVSVKGGVGKTTTVANLGAVLAKDFKQKVLVVDSNFSAPNLGIHFGIITPEKTLNDVLNDKCKIDAAIVNHPAGFDILPSNLLATPVNPTKLKSKLSSLKDKYDIILIDSSPDVGDQMLSTMIASDSLLVISSPDYPTLSCTLQAAKIAKERRTPVVGLVLNKVRGKKFELSTKEIEAATDIPILAVVPDDVKVLEALAFSVPATLYAPRKDFAVEFRKLAASLIGNDYEDKSFVSKIKKLMKGDTVADRNRRKLLKKK